MKYYRLETNGLLLCGIFIFISVFSGHIVFSQSENVSPGKLSSAHRHVSASDQCLSCHDADDKIDFHKCLTCHKEIFKRIKSTSGYHKDKNGDCQLCHQEHKGEDSTLIQWDVHSFDHSETGYILLGAHKKIRNCMQCHAGTNSFKREKSVSYLLKSNQCSGCHRDVHNKKYPACNECHATDDWSVDTWIP